MARSLHHVVNNIFKNNGSADNHFLPHMVCQLKLFDNGSQLVSEEFETFLKMNGIQHLTSAPYHPTTNGLAERFVRTMKEALKNDKGNVYQVPT